MDLTPFRNLIRERTGLSFEDHQSAKFSRAIHEMVSKKGLESYAEYFELLLHNQNDFFDLINLLTINETFFFREPAHLRIFSERLIPELLQAKRSGMKVRILSAGCSTGEEPYSLAMALAEKYGMGIQNLFLLWLLMWIVKLYA